MDHWTEERYHEYMQKFNKPPASPCQDKDEGPESDLQVKCEKWCKDHGYPYLHDRSIKKNPPGMFLDLYIFMAQARVVICELKVANNKMSPEQVDTYRKLLFLGHEVHEVRSYKRFLEIVNKIT